MSFWPESLPWPQFVYGGTQGATIVARADNTLVRGGVGADAIVAQGGRNVLDGGGGSDWLVGGTGRNSFIVDARGRTWSTVVGLRAGDDVSVRGVQGAASTYRWEAAAAGVDGHRGATLVGTVDGAGDVFAVTFAGLLLEDAFLLSAVIEPGTDGAPVLRLRAPDPAAPGDATYAITDVTTGASAVGLLDVYQGAARNLRYQHVRAGDEPVVLVARASDSLLRGGAGTDALVVYNGNNVLDGGGGSNWLVGGAGIDAFLVRAGGDVGAAANWDTILNFQVPSRMWWK